MDRLERLKLFLITRDFSAAVLSKPANIAAFFHGAQVSLGFRQEPPGRIAVCVTGEKVILLGNQTEVIRIAEDDLSWLHGLTARQYRWDEWDMRTCVKAYLDSQGIKRVCDDTGVIAENVSSDLEGMYYPLSNEEIENIGELGKDTASIVESVAKNLVSGATEVQVAGEVAGQLVSRSIWPEFIMIAGDERVSRFRHYVPKEIPIRRLCLLSVTVHRRGLYVSLTRLVSLGAVTPELRHLQQACNRIATRAIILSKPGASAGEIFRKIKESYADEGYPDEWTAHHQGGPAGFRGRDYRATEHESRCLMENQPIVWNPTVRGTKSEDTILTGQTGQIPKILTDTGNWVYYNVSFDGGTIRRPAILEK